MKDSGVEWLGMIPEHWDIERAKNLFTKMERPVRESDEVITCFRDGTVTLRRKRRTEGFTESLKEIGYQGIRVGDLVIHAMDAFAGAVGVADSDGKGTPVYAVCKPKARANAKYHALVIREMARNKWILALATGIRERSTDFRFSTYANQRVPLPPIPEQVAIARYLNYVDARVRRLTEAKRKLIGLLTEYKQAIIHRAVTRGLDPNVPLKDSGIEWLGMVPQHWEVSRLGFRLTRNDSGVWGNNFSDSGTVVLRSTEQTVSGDWQINSPAKIILPPEDVASALLKTGDLVVTKSSGSQAHIGKTSLVTDEIAGMGCCFSNFMQRLRLNENTLPALVWWNLNSQIGREQFVFYTTTTTGLGNLNGTILKGIRLAFPPLSEQVAIVEYLDRTTAKIDIAVARAKRQIELLNEYRTRLIADVVTGKLDVRDAKLDPEKRDR